MITLSDKEYENMTISKEDLSRESIIILDLVPGIIHEINNSLTSAMASTEVLQEEMIKLRKDANGNNININLVNHIEKLSTLNNNGTLKNQNIIKALLKEEINTLKDQCNKKNIEDSKFDILQNILDLNMRSGKKIDLIVKAFRKLVYFEGNINLIDVNEVVNTSILLLEEQLKNRYTIREDFSELPLVSFNFHQLNYIIVCILLKTIELMNSGELHFKTFETDSDVHILIQLNAGEISQKNLDIMSNQESKIDIGSINKLLQHRGGTLDIKKLNEKLNLDFKNEMSAGLLFDIKLEKTAPINSNLDKDITSKINKDGYSLNEKESQEYKIDSLLKINNEKVNSKNILIIDDNPQTLVSLFLSLKNLDLINKVIIAKNAEAALEQFEELNFNLVISDYKLPGMNGIELLSRIKDKYPDTTRVLITGFLNKSLKEEAETKASVKLIIEKPWARESLDRLIQEIV
ncbi:MAG TPA: response regulator, partial [Methanofastidiosum sp.]|nr:response regulator [Methanofastidiosum sp.]HNU60827.1 response regulator [Methanofastidiosum sp.]